MSKGGLHSWQRMVDADVRERQLALARGRQLVARCMELEAALLAERGRRDEEERRCREVGELPGFARERMAVLLERAIERAGEKVAQARAGEARLLDALREAFRRASAVGRVIDRRDARELAETLKVEQRELDEIASRRTGATPVEVGR